MTNREIAEKALQSLKANGHTESAERLEKAMTNGSKCIILTLSDADWEIERAIEKNHGILHPYSGGKLSKFYFKD